MELVPFQLTPPPEAAFQQSVAYAQAAAACGAVVHSLALRDGADVLAVASVVQRRWGRLISRGPVWVPGVDRRTRLAGMRRFARFPGATLMTPEAEEAAGFGLIPLVTSMHHAIWDLRPDPEDLRRGLAGKWRNRLGVAERAGLVPSPATSAGLHRLLSRLLVAEAAMRQRRGYRSLPPQFYRALPPEGWRIWGWHQGTTLRAGLAFYRHGPAAGGGASYLLGWGDQVAREAGVQGLMLWQAALALRAEGVGWLDLGSLDAEAAPGLARFKLGTGAALRKLGATSLVLPG